MAWMYLLRCSNGAFYTGSTAQDIEARVWQHNEGLGANFTRKYRPVELVFCEQWDRVDDAYAREKQVQGWSRAKKQALIDGEFERLPALSRRGVRSREDEED
jgi:putative endonuclease